MIILSYGYKKPQNPDTGDIFFPAWEFNIDRINSHNHDGVNSAPLGSVTQAIAAGGWAAAPIGGGVYRQLVNIPNPFQYDTCHIWFKLSTNEYIFPRVERVSNTSYYIYTNNNALAYIANYR